jgi:hypothetical protein
VKKELAENRFFDGKKTPVLIKPVQPANLARLIASL